jgi:phage repressor protein C with HTH and peptisase S24 domain
LLTNFTISGLLMDDPKITERVLGVIAELFKAGKIKNDIDFFRPIGLENPTTVSLVMNHSKTERKLPKKYLPAIERVWGVNLDYLHFGKGPMFKYSQPLQKDNVNDIPRTGEDESLKQVDRDLIAVPLVVRRAQAGYALSYADPEYVRNMPKVFIAKEFDEGNFIAFEVKGDSMDDNTKRSFCEGDEILTKELSHDMWHYKLHYEKNLFVIVYNESCILKQIVDHNTETGEITCHSYNPTYNDFKLNLKDVYQLFYVKKIIGRSVLL